MSAGAVYIDEFELAFGEYVDARGSLLLSEETEARKDVSKEADLAILALFAAAGIGAAAGGRTGAGAGQAVSKTIETSETLTGRAASAPKLAKSGLSAGTKKLLAIGLAGALAAGAAGYAAYPAAKAHFRAMGQASEVMETGLPAGTELRTPSDWTIQAPDAGFTSPEGLSSGHMSYAWFTSKDADVLVQVATWQQEAGTEERKAAQAGGLEGYFYTDSGARCLVLYAPELSLFLSWYGGEEGEMLEYAERLIEANRK